MINTPLYNFLYQHYDKGPTSFHMPGHKFGRLLPKHFTNNIFHYDITEITGADNLHFSEGVIQQAQAELAKAYGVKESFFLVNGSSSGIHSMILSACKKGDKIIVARNCHRSVIGAIILAGAIPIYIQPEYEHVFSTAGAISSQKIKEAVNKHPDSVAIIITSPNFYGICSDIKEIAHFAHKKNMLLLVDGAHGAHLEFHESLPQSAVSSGADIVVHSAHKTLPALTQGAYLHINSERVNADLLRFYLRTLQTTSPSYPIMASLDLARGIMQENGHELLSNLLHILSDFEAGLTEIDSYKLCGKKNLSTGFFDHTRLVVQCMNSFSGFELGKVLHEQHHIQVEMCDFKNIVLITTLADTQEDMRKLLKSLAIIQESSNFGEAKSDISFSFPSIPECIVPPSETLHAKGKWIPLLTSKGYASKNIITPYPPGIPFLSCGERIEGDAIDILRNILRFGGTVNGLSPEGEIEIITKA